MRLFRKPDEAEQHFKQARRYADPDRKEFDLRQAIEEFRQAITLKPEEAGYYAELGLTYLRVPELAVIRQVDVPFWLRESANRALPELEKAAAISEHVARRIEDEVLGAIDYQSLTLTEQEEVALKIDNKLKESGWEPYSGLPALSHLCLGEHEKAIRAVTGFKEGWEESLPKENVSLIFNVMQLQSQSDGWRSVDGIDKYFGMHLGSLGVSIAGDGEGEPGDFAELIEAGGWTDATALGILDQEQSPEEAREHLQQVVTYRNLGKYKDADIELQQARQIAPDLAWWYRTLCELAS